VVLLSQGKEGSELAQVADAMGKELELALEKEGGAHIDVAKDGAAGEVGGGVLGEHRDLVEAAVEADSGEEGLVESKDRLFGGGDVLFEGELSEGVDDGAGVDLVRAAGAAGFAADAEPDGGGMEEGVLLAELDEAQDLGRRDVHGIGSGAAGGAAEAVVTTPHVLLAQFTDLFDETKVGLHCSSL